MPDAVSCLPRRGSYVSDMRFSETKLRGAFVVDVVPHVDERGFFARAFCTEEFAAHGLPNAFPQLNLSRNTRRGTLRGMHFNAAPHGEAKLVRAVSGAVFDVIVDLRPGSSTRGRSIGVELSAHTARALFVPPGFAHGFLTLTDDADVLYQMGAAHRPEAARGFRWDDPRFGIAWPFAPEVISARDATYADFEGFDA